jgi:hypothetical protein
MNSHIQAQINAAQTSAEKVFHEDRSPIDLEKQKTVAKDGFGISLSDSGNIVTATPVDKRPVEGPKLGQEAKQSGSSLHAPASNYTWGKPAGR